MTLVREARPALERPGFKDLLRSKGQEIDVVKRKAPKEKAKPLRFDFGDMATDAEEMAYRGRMSMPYLVDNECSACGELVCGCLVGGKLQADASTELLPFEGSTAWQQQQ